MSSKKSSSSKNKSSLSQQNKKDITQEEIDIYINNKLLNAKKGKSAIIMVGGPGSGKSSGIKVLFDMTKKN
jgi:predicted GTPase